ncbi:MAG: hypothetical protein AAF545_00490 [Pseudomonadota bacterium]
MTKLTMPEERDFGWKLKTIDNAFFQIHERANGQFCVVLNHPLIRGVSAEMLHWWFLNFTRLKVRLADVEGYQGQLVPAYLLWHPSDHVGATLSGKVGPGHTAKVGATIEIQEAMQYDKYGWKYPVNNKLKVYYCDADGWAMGKQLPAFGPVMMLRIHFKDVVENGEHLGVHYHYEIVIGVSASNALGRSINRRITGHFSPEFFEAWQTHNVIEVGTFENFLPALFAQREQGILLDYEMSMDAAQSPVAQVGYDRDLFLERLRGYTEADDPHRHQAFQAPSFLT